MGTLGQDVRYALRALGRSPGFAAAAVVTLALVHPADPLVLAAVVIVLGSAVLLASWLPARRASRTDPMEALRTE